MATVGFKGLNILLSAKNKTIQYDTIEEFNVDWKAECSQLNIAHETKTKTPVHT